MLAKPLPVIWFTEGRKKKLKKVKKTLDTYRENVVYLDIRFNEGMKTRSRHEIAQIGVVGRQ